MPEPASSRQICSAYGNVGLSMGASRDRSYSADLHPLSQGIVLLVMVAGRVRAYPSRTDGSLHLASGALISAAFLKPGAVVHRMRTRKGGATRGGLGGGEGGRMGGAVALGGGMGGANSALAEPLTDPLAEPLTGPKSTSIAEASSALPAMPLRSHLSSL